MSDHTPTTDQVRSLYVRDASAPDLVDPDRGGMFDRWLAEVKAETWDNAVAAVAWCLENGPAEAAPAYLSENNPHRKEQTDD